ncbi:MAG: FAD-binding protein, partial [Alphaproteobacteria bacterium]
MQSAIRCARLQPGGESGKIAPRKRDRMIHLETDVLVVGSGGAGMYAAIAAARNGADVILADKSMIGRGGATIM